MARDHRDRVACWRARAEAAEAALKARRDLTEDAR